MCVPFSVQLSNCTNDFFSLVLKKRKGVPVEESKKEEIINELEPKQTAIALEKSDEENLLLKDKNKDMYEMKKQVDELTEKNKKLEENNKRLEKMLEKRRGKIKKLEDALEADHRKFCKRLQQAGEFCEMSCVMSCLVCACRLKLHHVHLCYDHLARIIMHGEEHKKYLRCAAYLSLLVKKEIAKKIKEIVYSLDNDDARDKEIDEIWEILRTTKDAKIMILGRIMEGGARHAIVCDLKNNKEEDNKLAFYDLQQWKRGRGTKEDLKYYLKEDKGINLYTLNLDSLKTLIEEKRDLEKEKCCTSGTSNDWTATAFDIFPKNRTRSTIPSDLS